MTPHLKQLKQDLLAGCQSFFETGLGFPLNKLTDQAMPAVKFLKDCYNPAGHKAIKTVYLAGFISKDSISANENQETIIESISRYPGMLLLAVELDSLSPSYTDIRKLTEAFNRATPAMPVTIVYRYNNGSRIALASCERFEYQQKHRVGERMGKTAILLDVNLQKPSRPHTELLSALKISKLPSEANEVETVLEHWRDRLRCRDKHLLLEIASEWLDQEKTLPPIEQVTEIFGQESITIIRNTSGWGSYYNFLQEACQDDSTEILKDSVMTLVRSQVEDSMTRQKHKPSIAQIQAKHRKNDLHLFTKKQAEEFLQAVLQERLPTSEAPQNLEANLVPSFLTQLANETENALEQGISLKNPEESEEEDGDDSDSAIDDNTGSGLPLSGPNLEDIEVRQSSLDAGEYDDLKICRYSVSKYNHKRLYTFVFERLISIIPEVTIGSVRKLDSEDLLKHRGFGKTQVNLLDELKVELLGIAQKILFEQAIGKTLSGYSEAELNFEIDFKVIPKSWMPVGTPQPQTLLRYFNDTGLSCNAANIGALTLSKLSNMKALREFRVDQLIETKRALPYLVATHQALEAFDQIATSDERIIQRDQLNMWERLTANKILWLVDDISLKVKHLSYNFREDQFTTRTPEKYHFKAKSKKDQDKYPILDDYRLASIKQKVARAIFLNEKDFFVNEEHAGITPREIDSTLLEHIDQVLQTPFYKNQDKLLKAVHLIRRGFIHAPSTLQSTADSRIAGLNKKSEPLTRERIRQFQAHGERQLLWSLPIAPAQISEAIANLSIEQLSERMPRLFTALHKNLTKFRRYIGFIAQDLSILLDVENTLLNSLFATTPGPIRKQQVLTFITEELQSNAAEEVSISDDLESQSKNIFETLILRNCLTVEENGVVRPTTLKHKEVIAHIYAGEQDGLPTQDGLEMTLKSELYPAKDLSKRYVEQQICLNPYLFQSGKSGQTSLYKHVNYLPHSVVGEELIKWIQGYFDAQSEDRIDLRTAFNSYQAPSDFDYYAFRHYIREFSIEEGLSIKFDGKSGVDNLKRAGASSKRITNQERVFKLIKEVPEGMTINEITNEFHCHNETLVGQQIYNLITEGKVWKISARLYSTPKNFKATLDDDDRKALGKIKEGLKTLLDEAERIGAVLDTSLLAQKINNEQSTDFHKNLYTSVVSSSPEYPELYKKRSLVSRNPFPDMTLSEVFAKHCKKQMSQAEAIAEVSQHVLATEECLKRSYNTWIYRLKNGKIQAYKAEPQQTSKTPTKINQPTPTEAKVSAPTATSKKKVITVKPSKKAKVVKDLPTEIAVNKVKAKKVPTSKEPGKIRKQALPATPAKKAQIKASIATDLPAKARVKQAPASKATIKGDSAKAKQTPSATPVKKATKKAAKKTRLKKTQEQKEPSKNVPTKKVPIQTTQAKTTPAKKATLKTELPTKNAVKKTASKKTRSKSTSAQKNLTPQTATKKAAKKAPVKKVTVKKLPAKKAPTKKPQANVAPANVAPANVAPANVAPANVGTTPSNLSNKKKVATKAAKTISKTPAKKTDEKNRTTAIKRDNRNKNQIRATKPTSKKPGIITKVFNFMKNI